MVFLKLDDQYKYCSKSSNVEFSLELLLNTLFDVKMFWLLFAVVDCNELGDDDMGVKWSEVVLLVLELVELVVVDEPNS